MISILGRKDSVFALIPERFVPKSEQKRCKVCFFVQEVSCMRMNLCK